MNGKQKDNAFYARNRNAWRKWLEKHHASRPYVWLIIYRKAASTPSLVYAEAVEEALCFGWIDSKPNKRDAESYFLFFAPRKPKSVWSALNKKRVEKLMAENKIHPAGLARITQAQKDGSWRALDAVEALQMPPELEQKLMRNKQAFKNFNEFPPSAKKGILQWIQSAKTAVTREKRIAETVRLAALNQRANTWKPKKD